MPRRSDYDKAKLDAIRKAQLMVITRKQALDCGMRSGSIGHKIGRDGPWQVQLPGVYLTVTGAPTRDQLTVAALLYAGEKSIITGPEAVLRHGLRSLASSETGVIDVLIPQNVRRQSAGFVRLHRTERLPNTWKQDDGSPIRYAEATRAVADAARGIRTIEEVRALVYEAVQKKACGVRDLLNELANGPTQRCSLLRTVLLELVSGIRSHAERDLQTLIRRGGIPEPMYNARLYTLEGEFIAMVDGWLEKAATALEVDSLAYHISVAAQDRDRNRHTRLITHGIYPMHLSPHRIRTEPTAVLADIRSAIETNRREVPLPIVAVGPDQRWSPDAAAAMVERIALAEAAMSKANAQRHQAILPKPNGTPRPANSHAQSAA